MTDDWQPLNLAQIITTIPKDEEPPLDGNYLFVITKNGNLRLFPHDLSHHHPDLIFEDEFARALDIVVGYAGTVEFNKGRLKKFTNISGHFVPRATNRDADLCIKNILMSWSKDKNVQVEIYLHPWRS